MFKYVIYEFQLIYEFPTFANETNLQNMTRECLGFKNYLKYTFYLIILHTY